MSQRITANTHRAYRASWKDFQRWCEYNDRQSLPASPGTLNIYILERDRDLALSTLNGRIAAIRHYHEQAGHETPTDSAEFREFWQGLRSKGGQLLVSQIEDEPIQLSNRKRQLIPEADNDLLTLRDRAIILLGIWGDLQRSEIAGINREDVILERNRAFVKIANAPLGRPSYRVSLQQKDHRRICPVRALQAWIEASQIHEGPLFRPINRHRQISPRRISDYGISLVVKRAAENAGLDPSKFSAEDLRQRPAK